jgi:mannose-6-phosphate isomerase-like protein (cupin superfamily)
MVWVRALSECPEFEAGDHTLLRELLNPHHDELNLRYSLAHARLEAGRWSAKHRLKTSEVYYILSGAGRMEIDGDVREVSAGDAIYIPPLSTQRIFSVGPAVLEFLCIVDPAWRPEDEDVDRA